MNHLIFDKSPAWVEFFDAIDKFTDSSSEFLVNGFPSKLDFPTLEKLEANGMIYLMFEESVGGYYVAFNFEFSPVAVSLVGGTLLGDGMYPSSGELSGQSGLFIEDPEKFSLEASGKKFLPLTFYSKIYREFSGVIPQQKNSASLRNIMRYLCNQELKFKISYVGKGTSANFVSSDSFEYSPSEVDTPNSKYGDMPPIVTIWGGNILGIDRGHVVIPEYSGNTNVIEFTSEHEIFYNPTEDEENIVLGLKVEIPDISDELKSEIKEALSSMVPARSLGVQVV